MFVLTMVFLTASSFAQDVWNAEMRNIFLESCTKGRPAEISVEDMFSVCSCSLNNISAKFSPSQLNSPQAQQAMEGISAKCSVGTRGNWTSLVKKQFLTACVSKKSDGITDIQQRSICQCSLDLIEAKYDPLNLNSPEAQTFAGRAGEICATDVLGQ